jgi:hypothetical protein
VNRVMCVWFYKREEISFPVYNQSLSNSVGRGTAPQPGRLRFVFLIVSLTYSFQPHYVPVVDLASNRNENQECFLWVKAAGV